MKVFLIGPIPPPVYGMAIVNGRVSEQLLKLGADIQVIDLAAPNLNRGFFTRFRRLSKVVRGLLEFWWKGGLRGQVLYMSVSGGLGQVYELLFLYFARINKMWIVLHHHSFAYLGARNYITHALIKLAGRSSVHIALSPQMAKRLQIIYEVAQVVSISNAAFLLGNETPRLRLRQQPKILGFISNITVEKGIFKFLDLMAAIQAENLPIAAKIAGPFPDIETNKTVCKYLENLNNTEYVGPKYGNDKDNFFAEIDVLVFPTLYKNEAEPLTIHEAMMRGIPVIAYGRGGIPEIVDSSCGLVVPPADDFVPAALAHIRTWIDFPKTFYDATLVAAERSSNLYGESKKKWEDLTMKMIQGKLG